MSQSDHPADLSMAFGSGGLLTLMIFFNGAMAAASGPLWSSLAAHATGTIAAITLVLILKRRAVTSRAPLWAYAGGLAGAVTVMLSSVAVNTMLALSGTIALGLLGQVAFSIASDRWGLFGLPKRHSSSRELAGGGLILAGCGLIIVSGALGP